ncbi:MAG: hypothetical protein RL630_675 [Verrucomicrobiota bacterium]|jgi:hypothetical protein
MCSVRYARLHSVGTGKGTQISAQLKNKLYTPEDVVVFRSGNHLA